MSLEEIEAFLCIAQTGSISAASETMFLTQPALSRRIKSLEEELGYTLFLRSKGLRRIELTPEGQAFIHVAERWKDLWNETRNIITISPANTLRVDSIDSITTTLLTDVYRSFLSQNPGKNLQYRTTHSLSAYNAVADASTDMAFVTFTRHSSLVDTLALFSEPMVLVSATDYGNGSPVDPASLSVANEIYKKWHPGFEPWHQFWFGEGVRPRLTVDHITLMCSLLSDPGTFCIMPLTTALWAAKDSDLLIQPLQSAPPERTVYCLTNHHLTELPPLARQFLDIFIEELRQIEGLHVLV